MLVLTRKLGQQVKIGDHVVVTVLKTQGKTVRIGVEAPRDMRVLRGELPHHDTRTPHPERWSLRGMRERVRDARPRPALA